MSSEAKRTLAIFASGTGSNAEQICTYFQDHDNISVQLIVTNRMHAGVLDVASKHHIDAAYIPKLMWDDPENVLPLLESKNITHIILAGFLLLIPAWLVNIYKGRILNIHPALLPKYGGQGMFGSYVHQRVKNAGDLISGITIHEVNENYDEGDVVFQTSVELHPDDNAVDIATKVLKLEHYHYPRVIEKWVSR